MLLTVPEAARRVGRDPETVRRWIRTGRLPSQRVGTQHLIDEGALLSLVDAGSLPVPEQWRRTWTGEPAPDWVAIVARSRRSH